MAPVIFIILYGRMEREEIFRQLPVSILYHKPAAVTFPNKHRKGQPFQLGNSLNQFDFHKLSFLAGKGSNYAFFQKPKFLLLSNV